MTSDSTALRLQLGHVYETRDGKYVHINGSSVDGNGFCSAPQWYCSWDADGACRQRPGAYDLVRDCGPYQKRNLVTASME